MGNDELIDVLEKRGLRGLRGDIQSRRREVLEGLKPRSFLTAEEIAKARAALQGLRLPSPKGMADALIIRSRRHNKENFSLDRIYCPTCLRNLAGTLYAAGLKDEGIFRKLERVARKGERYRIDHCIYPKREEATWRGT